MEAILHLTAFMDGITGNGFLDGMAGSHNLVHLFILGFRRRWSCIFREAIALIRFSDIAYMIQPSVGTPLSNGKHTTSELNNIR